MALRYPEHPLFPADIPHGRFESLALADRAGDRGAGVRRPSRRWKARFRPNRCP